MKKLKGNGFTLIELLAIIVILGIIAVIAVPTVKKLTDEAKLKAFENTARGIIKAGNLYYSRKDMMDAIEGDMVFTFPNNAEELELQGELPENGKMIINEDGDIALAISNEKYCITKSIATNEIETKEDYETCTIPNPYMTSTHICVTSGTCTQEEIIAGIKVNVKVNNKQNYDFYVIADTGTELTLLMDRNLGTQVAWYKDNDDTTNNEQNNLGPITVLNYLNNQINSELETWINVVPITSYEYINNKNGTENACGYQKLTISNGTGVLTSQDGTTTNLTGTMRARLLTHREYSTLKSLNSNTTPTWLYENLSSTNTTEAPFGYWFLTAHQTISTNARNLHYDGTHSNAADYIGYETQFGLRPVIIMENDK